MRNKWWAWGCAVWMACAPLAAQNLQKGDYGYLYCHMSGRGEWTAYALSRDGLHYEDLLGGGPVYDVEKLSPIEGGARDAYICRRVRDGDDGYEQPEEPFLVQPWHRLASQ